jgi:23S rRNA (guanosine2251-2'-O)-methyltransferase
LSRSRKKPGKFQHVVPGERAVSELLEVGPERVRELVIETGKSFPELEALAARGKVDVQYLPRAHLDGVAGPGLARGVLATAECSLEANIVAHG